MYNRYWARMATRESWFERACCGHMTEEAAWCFRPSVRGTVQGASMDRSFVLTLGCWLWASVAVAQPKTKDYDLATASISGDVLRGPRRITAHNLNVLRYDYRFKGAISFTQAADLWSRLTSLAAPAPAGPPPAAPSPGASRSVNCQADVRAEGVSDAVATQHICAARQIAARVARMNTESARGSDGSAGHRADQRRWLHDADHPQCGIRRAHGFRSLPLMGVRFADRGPTIGSRFGKDGFVRIGMGNRATAFC